MSFSHVVAWIDHAEAHIIHFSRDEAEAQVIKTHARHSHQHVRAGAHGSGHAPENAAYFNDIAQAVRDALVVLVVGPGLEKLALMKHWLQHQPGVAEKVISVETLDHPSDGQLLKYARKYFVKADLFR
ncbi:MAG: translational machinery protein [Pseudomonadota bacterium]